MFHVEHGTRWTFGRPMILRTISPERIIVTEHDAQPSIPSPSQRPDPAGIERSLDRLMADLGRLSDDADRQSRLAALGTIAGLIAHELNNLLTPAVGYGRAALRRPDDAEFGRKALQRCVEAAERAALVSASVLDLAAGTPTEEPGSADIADVIRTEIGANGISADGVPLSVSIESGVRAAIRPERLERVLQNLISNARRAMTGRTGSVRLTACSTGNECEIVVEDDGPGLPDGSAVFDAFVSGSKSSGGTGLGLTLCRELIRDANGKITAEQADSGGAKFVISLPLAGSANPADTAA